MAYNEKSLVRIATGAASDVGHDNASGLFLYRTPDALGTGTGQVGEAGYFNNARARLHKGDVIIAVGSVGTTPIVDIFVVTAVPAPGSNVTVARHVDDDGS